MALTQARIKYQWWQKDVSLGVSWYVRLCLGSHFHSDEKDFSIIWLDLFAQCRNNCTLNSGLRLFWMFSAIFEWQFVWWTVESGRFFLASSSLWHDKLTVLYELVSVLFRINPETVRHFLLVDRSKAFPGAPKKMTARTYRKKRYVGIVVDDQSLQVGKSLEKCRHVRSIYQHFCEGKDWCDTEYVELYERRYKRLQLKRKLGSTFEDFCQQKIFYILS